MRGLLLGAVVWLALGGVAAAASGTDVSASPVVIHADQGQPTHMATYGGPGGVPIPVGACGAVIGGHVWVLPCSDPQVIAYQKAAAASAARAAHTRNEILAGGVLVLAVAVGASAERIHRRRIRRKGV